MFKTLGQLSKAYKDGKLLRKNKLVIDGDTARVSAVPLDKQTQKPVKGAEAVVVFECPASTLVADALKLAGIPLA